MKVVVLLFSEKSVGGKYLNLLSQGGLIDPSENLSNYVSHGFSILDASLTVINNSNLPAQGAAEHTLKKGLLNDGFVCDQHVAVVCKYTIRIIANIFSNNKRKLSSNSVLHDGVKSFKK